MRAPFVISAVAIIAVFSTAAFAQQAEASPEEQKIIDVATAVSKEIKDIDLEQSITCVQTLSSPMAKMAMMGQPSGGLDPNTFYTLVWGLKTFQLGGEDEIKASAAMIAANWNGKSEEEANRALVESFTFCIDKAVAAAELHKVDVTEIFK